MRRAPDIFGVHALRDPPVCSTRRAESSWDTSGRCSSFAGIRVLAWPCLPMSALKLRWSNDAVQDPKTTRLAVCVSSLYLQSGSARSPSRNEIMTSSITNTSRSWKRPSLSSIALKSDRFSLLSNFSNSRKSSPPLTNSRSQSLPICWSSISSARRASPRAPNSPSDMFATNYCHRMNYIMLTSPHYCTSPVPLAQIDLSDCPVIWQQKAASSLLPSPRLRPPAAQSLPPRSAPVRHFAMRSG